ncbi:MAG: TolC family protein [Candidatus Hydrogenedentes bacterium]|nr:TolC family protein [Candidatus Hydrogenedentota bacterium]
MRTCTCVRDISILLSALMAFWGCSTAHYRQSADREAYGIIRQKTPNVPGMTPEFSIETQGAPDLAGLPALDKADEFMGDEGKREIGSTVLTLEQALSIAVKNSREYQSQKEAVYLSALNLSLARHQFAPIFSGTASGTYRRTTRDLTQFSDAAAIFNRSPELAQGIGTLVGTPGDLLSSYAQLITSASRLTGLDQPQAHVVDDRSLSGQTGIGVGVLLSGGAQIAVDLTSNFLRFLTGDPRVSATSALVSSIRQPLLRGAGSKVVKETLTQSERDCLYQLRAFARYRQEFTVNIASAFYRVLQNHDAVRNNWAGYKAQERAVERQRALSQAGRLKKSELGRTEQAELDAKDAWNNSIRVYKEALDQFKIQLGLSTDAQVALASSELDELMLKELAVPAVTSEDAIQVALKARLDLYTSRDQKDDADRKVTVAANGLKPQLDVLVNGQVTSSGADNLSNLDFERSQWGVGLDADLGLDRKQERNTYRAALIALDRATRALSLSEDNTKLQVRAAYRDLEQAQRSFEIRQLGVKLNQGRVEEQDLLSQAGRATALDQIDAQNALISSRNALTAAVVDHTIARLRFWSSMGILYIKDNGQWEEVTDDKRS